VKLLGRLLILAFFISTEVQSALDFEDHAFPEFVTSARALALGNAYICKVDDPWSAFYNPAGLGTVRRPQFHIANFHIEASDGFLDAVGSGPAYDIPKNFLSSQDAENIQDLLSENRGKLAHTRINLFPNLTLRGITLGYMYSQRFRAILNDEDPDPTNALNTLEIAKRRDHGPVVALSGSFFGGVLKLGASAVYLNRSDLYKSFTPSEVPDLNDSDYKTGESLQVTGGVRLTLPVAYLPTFAAVIRNPLDSTWDNPSANGGPDVIKQTIDVGASITPHLGKVSRLHIEANLKDLNNAYDTNAKRRLAAGMELDFNRRIFLRAGYGDGWGSGGIGVRSRNFIFDFTTYAIDRSQDKYREEEDRRWVLSISSGL
jgi:hypothetical protein